MIPVDGVGKLVTSIQGPPRATCGEGESGAGAPAVRPQHVEVRVAESQFRGVVLEDQQTARATRVVNRPSKASGARE